MLTVTVLKLKYRDWHKLEAYTTFDKTAREEPKGTPEQEKI